MRAITKFVSIDGAEFDTQRAAEDRDALVLRCREIAAMIGPHPYRSGERVKHPKLDEYRAAVVGLYRDLFPRAAIFQQPAKEIHPFSFAGRFLYDCAPRPVSDLWHRLMCVGDDGYEYEQPFFALNPDKFKADAA